MEVGQRSETESASVIEGDAASEAQEQQVNVVGDVKSEADVAPTVMSDTPEMVEEDAPGDVESNSAGSSNENNGLESESVESGSENAGSESGAAESGSEDSGLESESVESGSENAGFESGSAEMDESESASLEADSESVASSENGSTEPDGDVSNSTGMDEVGADNPGTDGVESDEAEPGDEVLGEAANSGTDSGSESVSQQTSEEVESTSVSNWSDVVSDSVSFGSEIESVSASASKSDSIVQSISVSNSESMSRSHSNVLSESASASTAISESLSAYNSTSMSYEIDDVTGDAASALSTYDSALSMLNSTSTAEEDISAAQQTVAESIIKYTIASKGLVLDTDKGNGGIQWNEDGGYYTVYYKDSNGREFSEAYQYSAEGDKVSVNKADISYEMTDGKVTMPEYGGNGKPPKPSEKPVTGNGPEVDYEIVYTGDGGTTVTIKIGDNIYTDADGKLLDRQINPDGSISYILVDDNDHRELFVVNADGSKGYYTTYNKTDKLFNNASGSTETDIYTVNGVEYTVAGGNGFDGKYAIVQDEKGGWHKFVIKGTDQQIVIRDRFGDHNFYWQAGGKGRYEKIGSDCIIKVNANGEYCGYGSRRG